MDESITVGELPRVRWSAVIVGALCALAIQIVLTLFGLGFGFAARPTGSSELGVVAVIWNLLVPLIASGIGASIAVRNAAAGSMKGAYLHGALVWAIGLIAGSIFLTGTIAASAISPRPELGPVASAPPSTSKGAATRESQALQERRNDAAKAAAAASALGGLAAIFGLGGAFLGAELGRRELVGQPWLGGHRGHRLRYGREEEAIPPGAHPH